jgi:NAD-dependent histone deacetylase SIR2
MSGAGISVHAGIPDFRSSNGLFESLKREHPKENITSGRDLFDAAVFKVSTTSDVIYAPYLFVL